jgi:hypothetical protein
VLHHAAGVATRSSGSSIPDWVIVAAALVVSIGACAIRTAFLV